MSRDGHLDWSRKTWQPSLLYRVARLGIMKSLTSHQQTFRLRWYDLASALGWKGLSFSFFLFLPDILFFPFLCKGMTIFYREERKKRGETFPFENINGKLHISKKMLQPIGEGIYDVGPTCEIFFRPVTSPPSSSSPYRIKRRRSFYFPF